MKKKTARKIKDLAALLPNSIFEAKVVEVQTGWDLLKREEAGEDITYPKNFDPKKKYKMISTKVKQVNHSRKLRKYFKQYGAKTFLDQYMDWFSPHHKRMVVKYPNIFADKATQHA